jgi:hypothetical protein
VDLRPATNLVTGAHLNARNRDPDAPAGVAGEFRYVARDGITGSNSQVDRPSRDNERKLRPIWRSP